MIARLLILLLALFGWAAPAVAQSEDIAAARRSVVRVAVAIVEGDQIQVDTIGTGFAVGPNRVVTNAHVVEQAISNPQSVQVGVVPSEGAPGSLARVVAFDAQRDLALLELEQGSLPAIPLFTGRIGPGTNVVALGYPGNVDRATVETQDDLLLPRPPLYSTGVFADMRQAPVGPVIVHTAQIARGHSGGPLLDACGRVAGVNTALANNEGGDASFGFAITVNTLTAFLRENGQGFRTIDATCVSAEARDRSEAERAERERRAREADEANRVREADRRRAEALDEIRDVRETRVGISVLLIVLAIAAMTTAAILFVRNLSTPAIVAAAIAAMLVIASAIIFFTRPSLRAAEGEAERSAPDEAEPSRYVGSNQCRLDRARSRITVSEADSVNLEWGETGCVNEGTQYAREGDVWRRVLVPNQEQTVSLSEFNPSTGEYVVSRYLLSARAMSEARRLRQRIQQKSCTSDEEALLRMADQQRNVVAALPRRPNERLVYRCTPD